MMGIYLSFSDLRLSDLRKINLTEAPDWDAIREDVSKKIIAKDTKARVLETLSRAEHSKTNVEARVIIDAIIDRNCELARGLGALIDKHRHFSRDREAEYLDLLWPYIANDLACQNKKGFIAWEIARRAIYWKLTGLATALAHKTCLETIEKGLELLSEYERNQLKEITIGQEAAEKQQ